MHKYSVKKSWEIYDRSTNYLGCGSSTLSKAPSYRLEEPPLVVRGKGCRVWDADDNEYIDFSNGLGPISLGYAVPEIDEAIRKQLESGIIFGRPHPLEGEVAELICDVVPCAERARFLKTGGEAVAACIRIARGATGRDRIVQCGYNGWLNRLSDHAGFQPRGVASGSVKGIPQSLSELHMGLPWAQIDDWEKCFAEYGNEIAAAVISSDYGELEAGNEFLHGVRALTQKYGALLIMDEIVTGFRVRIAGVQEYFDFKPDLAVFAKGIANGMPFAAYVGRADLIDSCRQLSISSTFGGDALSLAAVKAVIQFYRERNVIDYLWKAGAELWNQTVEIFKERDLDVRFQGVPVCPQIQLGDGLNRDDLMKAACRNGIILYDVPYITYSHRDADIVETLDRFRKVAEELAR